MGESVREEERERVLGLEKKKRLVVEEKRERESLRFRREKSLVVEEKEFGKEEESDFEERD